MTTKDEIQRWFEEGVRLGYGYMLVICDTHDHSDYPKYTTGENEAKRIKADPGEMNKVMEIYDLNADMDVQLNQRRAMAL